MQISRHWRLNQQRYRLVGVRQEYLREGDDTLVTILALSLKRLADVKPPDTEGQQKSRNKEKI